DPNAITPFIPAGSGTNAFAIAGAIDAVFQNGSAPPEFLALINLPASSLPDAIQGFAGENESAAVQEGNESMRQFLGAVLDPFAGTRTDRQSAFGTASMWGAIYGGHLRLPGSAVSGSHTQKD